MERRVLILCHERPELADLQGRWQEEGISARMVSDIGEAAGELSGDMDYLLAIIFSEGKEYLSPFRTVYRMQKRCNLSGYAVFRRNLRYLPIF